MTLRPPSLAAALKRRLKTRLGKHFSRFVLVAVAAVAASQITLTICLGLAGLTAGISAIAAWLAGAAVSYVLSRWAWERKGRPHLLKETLPFWLVALGTAVVLTLTTKWANHQAHSMGLNHTQTVAFDALAYFIANCVTFLTRFVIFHYVLFADRGSRVPPSPAAPLPSGDAAAAEAASDPFAAAVAARVSGAAWAGGPGEAPPAGDSGPRR
jgi:putative flippase GtrA